MQLSPMRPTSLLVVLLIAPKMVFAQASPYIPLDDPRLPLIEHLIARGDIADPSPMVRPFRRSDVVRAIDRVQWDSTSANGRAAASLRRALDDGGAQEAWSISPRVGAQGFSHARRDLLEPAGASGVRGYADIEAMARFGPVVLLTRPVAENRIKLDPDWTGESSRASGTALRFADAYISAQFKWGRVFYGQMDRNWGPAGLPGIPLSNYGYPRSDLGLDFGNSRLRFAFVSTQLQDETDSAGATIHRFFIAHRLSLQVSPSLNVALWETAVSAGAGRDFEPSYRNPLTLLSFGPQFGLGDHRNSMIGTDVQWRAARGLSLGVQLAIDDWNFSTNPYPNRWAATVDATGALGHVASWHAAYTTATSLAFRTASRFENLTDGGVGLGRNFADNELLTMVVNLPLPPTWLVSPQASVLRQGQGQINTAWPTAAEARLLPTRFSGTIATTYQVGMGVSGQQGPLALHALGVFQHSTNADNVPGAVRSRLEGRVTATLGFTTRGAFK